MITIEQLHNVTTKSVEEINKLLPQISSHSVQLTYASLLAVVKDPASIVLIVKDGATIVGVGVLVMFHDLGGNRGRLEDIVVDEKYRGQGLGEKLVQKLIERAWEEKINRIGLTSKPDRVAANKLYQKVGFIKQETNVYRLKL